jgi:hypothetical protein
MLRGCVASKADCPCRGVVAHDLRGLATTASLSARMLEVSNLDDRQARAIHRIEQAMQQLDRLIQDLTDVDGLTTTRLSAAGYAAYSPEPAGSRWWARRATAKRRWRWRGRLSLT